MIWIDWDLDVRSIGRNQPQSLVEFRGVCFLYKQAEQHRNLKLRRIAGAGMFRDAESDVSTITIGAKSGLCYDGFLSGISTRNREPL